MIGTRASSIIALDGTLDGVVIAVHSHFTDRPIDYEISNFALRYSPA
jgi:hypothetical protein